MIRKAAEILSRRVILNRKLPAEFNHGPLYVTPASALKHWKFNMWNVDPMLLRIVLKYIHPGDIVWDIGANVGLFSFASANIVGESGKVLAIEADTFLVNILRKSAQMKDNLSLDVAVLPVAISDSVGIAKFNIARRGRAANYLADASGSSQTGGVRESQLVPSVTLDWLLERFPAPNFVKIDVEGAEDLVLKGAIKILSEIRPTLLCEVTGANSKSVGDILASYGYRLFDAQDDSIALGNHDAAPFNTIAIPGDKIRS